MLLFGRGNGKRTPLPLFTKKHIFHMIHRNYVQKEGDFFMKLAATVIIALLLASSFATAMYLFVSFFAENELEKSEFVKITNNRIEIFANYENLEYYIRCSMFAYAQQKTVIVIHIDRSDAHFDEIMYIAESFASRHGNVRCELI